MEKIKAIPDADYLRACFSYNKRAGRLLWRRRPRSHFATDNACATWNTCYANKDAGWAHRAPRSKEGYRAVALDAVKYLAHRIIWKMVTGADPTIQIDHINGNGTDNRWANLREATSHENGLNRHVPSHSKTGIKGVRLLPGGTFAAHIRLNGKFLHLGTFATAKEAAAARRAIARGEHGEFFKAT